MIPSINVILWDRPVSMKKALQYVSTLSAKGSAVVPANEDGRQARSSKYL